MGVGVISELRDWGCKWANDWADVYESEWVKKCCKGLLLDFHCVYGLFCWFLKLRDVIGFQLLFIGKVRFSNHLETRGWFES